MLNVWSILKVTKYFLNTCAFNKRKFYKKIEVWSKSGFLIKIIFTFNLLLLQRIY